MSTIVQISKQSPEAEYPCSRPPANQRVVEHAFRAVLVGELFAHKMAGFAEHVDAKIRKVDEHHVRMQIGKRGFLGWRDRSLNFPVDLRVTLTEVATLPGVFDVNADLRPVAVGVPKRFCQQRYEAILRELHSFLIPQLSAFTDYQFAS